MGENSPNLVTLPASLTFVKMCRNFAYFHTVSIFAVYLQRQDVKFRTGLRNVIPSS
jgi:hypothetical protein